MYFASAVTKEIKRMVKNYVLLINSLPHFLKNILQQKKKKKNG
jgi:hypothetical protein